MRITKIKCMARTLFETAHSSMLSPLALDPIRVQPCVWCLFSSNRNCMAVTSILVSSSLSNQRRILILALYTKWKYLLLLKLVILIILHRSVMRSYMVEFSNSEIQFIQDRQKRSNFHALFQVDIERTEGQLNYLQLVQLPLSSI